MRGNDLSNSVVPHDVLVWEGLLGLLTSPKIETLENKHRRRKRWDKAVACYEVNEMLARKIWYLTWHQSVEYDVMTFLGDGFAEALEARLDDEGLPVRRVFADDPFVFARNLIFNPDVRTVYDPDPKHQFVFGAKGHILLPDQYNLLGGM